jgi:hypothetical protein
MHRATFILFDAARCARSGCSDCATTMADARIALCLEAGVSMDDIDPASGYDYSRRSYDRVRASWVDHVRQHGASEFHEIRDIEWARSLWAEKRPQFVENDDWLKDGLNAHREFIAALGRPCNRSSCIAHDALSSV